MGVVVRVWIAERGRDGLGMCESGTSYEFDDGMMGCRSILHCCVGRRGVHCVQPVAMLWELLCIDGSVVDDGQLQRGSDLG